MSQQVACPRCSVPVVYDPALAGRVVSCPQCSSPFSMPQLPAVQVAQMVSANVPSAQPIQLVVNVQNKNDVRNNLVAVQSVGQGFGFALKSPLLAALLSFLWTGLGQIYNGQLFKGLFLMFLQVINFCLIAVLIGIPLLVVVWLYAIADAYSTAAAINNSAVGYGLHRRSLLPALLMVCLLVLALRHIGNRSEEPNAGRQWPERANNPAVSIQEAALSRVTVPAESEAIILEPPGFDRSVRASADSPADTARLAPDDRGQEQSAAHPAPARHGHLQGSDEWRTWTSHEGQFHAEAQFVKSMFGMVYLRKRDGTEIQVPLEKLADADQRFIRSLATGGH